MLTPLLTLDADELAFLTAPPAEAAKPGADWLERRLAATLAARLRLSVALAAVPVESPTDTSSVPLWRPDPALATLWLTRRLGGTRAAGSAPFVPKSLIETLDATLAEAWLGRSTQAGATFAWDVRTPIGSGRLALQLPEEAAQLTRWARGVIRHG